MTLALQGHQKMVVLTVYLQLAERADVKYSQYKHTHKRLITCTEGWSLSSIELINHVYTNNLYLKYTQFYHSVTAQ